jgi:hypothetical protein
VQRSTHGAPFPRECCALQLRAMMLAHLTPLEMPIVWIAFALGLAIGAGSMVLLRRRAAKD